MTQTNHFLASSHITALRFKVMYRQEVWSVPSPLPPFDILHSERLVGLRDMVKDLIIPTMPIVI